MEKKMLTLDKLPGVNDEKRPVVLIIMDGFGEGEENEGNAIYLAKTPNLDQLKKTCLYTRIRAHGPAVGLPGDGDMGNSEVGHNALGAGRVFDQGAKLVSRAIKSGAIFSGDTWKKLTEKPKTKDTQIHFIGLLSDGNVHSHINHLFSMIEKCAEEKIRRLNVHILLDGRDVPDTSALNYVDMLEGHLDKFRHNGLDYRIASGGGRMVTTMDRYEADWDIVKRGWEAHVLGKSRPFKSAREAIETFRKEKEGITDQYLPAFTITDEYGPVGPVLDGDSVVFFNFRGDRAIEISRAFDEDDFPFFDRIKTPDVFYAGMMEYDGDLKIPKNYLVTPPAIDKTISEYLADAGCRQYAVSETQKFGHVTYFWNGNRSGKFNKELETYEEVPSDKIEFDRAPEMKAAEIADKMTAAILSGKYDFLRLNFANGDMVGHTGNLKAAIVAAETVDKCVGRLIKVIEDNNCIAIITADHGNLDEMYELDKNGKFKVDKDSGERKKKTAHTLNPVPFIIFDPENSAEYKLAGLKEPPGLGNVASTILLLMGYEAPEDYLPSIIELK